jgi:hypothetical protein
MSKIALGYSCKVILHINKFGGKFILSETQFTSNFRICHYNKSRHNKLAKTVYNTDLENSYESGSCPQVNPCRPSSRSKSWPTIPASQHVTKFSRSSHKIRFYWNKPQYTAIRFFRLLKSQLIRICDKLVCFTM